MAAPVLPRSTPTAEGVDPAAVAAFVDAAERERAGVHSLMVVRHGAVIAEGWWAPFAPDVRHQVHSVSKSVLSTAIGIAQAEGILSIDEPAVDFFPGVEGPRDVLLRHLLSMSSGHDEDTMGLMRALPGEDWPRLFFASPFLFPPGEHFVYDSGGSYVLSAALQSRTGVTLPEFLEPRLFAPLGLDTPPWAASPAGVSLGGTGLGLLTEDIAVLAELYRRRGEWNGRQLVPADWIEEATRSHVDDGPNAAADWALGYGFQFWRSQHGYRMDGAWGQYGLVIPELDLVVAITAGAIDNATVLRLVWEHLLPGVDRARGTDAGGLDDAALGERLAHLDLPAPSYRATAPEVAARLNGMPIVLPFTSLHLSTVTLHLDGDRTVLETVGTDGAVERIDAARDAWLPGATAIWPHPELTGSRTGSRAGWVDDTTFEFHEQCIESAAARIWRFETGYGADDDVRVTVGLDLPFWSSRTERVVGRLGMLD
ncbi:serine hydrolase domain-containing protein [Pseudolysinimonas sp.]|uniref:serine hydrolase domain-containing protein n=1 Tax=Pseudolysinimonas sp. TaxID=2680009 RepID=UPI003F820E2A